MLNRRATIYLALVTLLVVAAGCTKMVLVNSPREQQGLDPVMHSHYDANSKVRYMVSNDHERIYLRFDTDSYRTIMCARKYGVIVHFDTEGKRKAPYFFHYPTYSVADVASIVVPEEEVVVMGGLSPDVFPPCTQALWHNKEESRTIDLGMADEGFVGSVEVDEKGVMVYRVGVPLRQLGVERPDQLANLVVLLEIPTSDSKEGNTSFSGSSSNPGASVTSGMPGSNMSNGGVGNTMGNGMGTSPMPAPRTSSGPSDIRIWMEVKLNPASRQ